jgi:predicted TIM-barrel fold metal-dependent hydrolase
VLELARTSHGYVTALARVDPADDPLGEAVRCLDAGAAGIKLHPLGEGFALDDRRLDDLFALADERRLPIMIHAGKGVPEMAGQVHRRSTPTQQAVQTLRLALQVGLSATMG